jgi:hypothetical protein
MQRVDKQVGAAERNSGCNATVTQPREDVALGDSGKAGLREPCRRIGEKSFVHAVVGGFADREIGRVCCELDIVSVVSKSTSPARRALRSAGLRISQIKTDFR